MYQKKLQNEYKNHALEPNIKSIVSPVAELCPFEVFKVCECAPSSVAGRQSVVSRTLVIGNQYSYFLLAQWQYISKVALEE